MTGIKCKECGSSELSGFGHRKTKDGEYKQYRCKKCRKFTVDLKDKRQEKKSKTKLSQPYDKVILIGASRDSDRTTETELKCPEKFEDMARKLQDKLEARDSPPQGVDGCSFSIPAETSPMGRQPVGPFLCAVNTRIRCSGQEKMRAMCPLWHGARVF